MTIYQIMLYGLYTEIHRDFSQRLHIPLTNCQYTSSQQTYRMLTTIATSCTRKTEYTLSTDKLRLKTSFSELCLALEGHKGHKSKAVGKEGATVIWQPLLVPAAACCHRWRLSSSTPDNVYMPIN